MIELTPEILAQCNTTKSFKDGFHILQTKINDKYFTYHSKKEVKYLEEWKGIISKHVTASH